MNMMENYTYFRLHKWGLVSYKEKMEANYLAMIELKFWHGKLLFHWKSRLLYLSK